METPNDYSHAFTDLMLITLTQDDWDGAGAKAPTDRTLGVATALLHALRDVGIKRPMLSLGHCGGVIFNWKNGRGWMAVQLHNDDAVAVCLAAGKVDFTTNWTTEKFPADFADYMLEHFKFNGAQNGTDRKS
jgi:hypothetical protein